MQIKQGAPWPWGLGLQGHPGNLRSDRKVKTRGCEETERWQRGHSHRSSPREGWGQVWRGPEGHTVISTPVFDAGGDQIRAERRKTASQTQAHQHRVGWVGKNFLHQKTQAKVIGYYHGVMKTNSSSNHVLSVVTVLVRSRKPSIWGGHRG